MKKDQNSLILIIAIILVVGFIFFKGDTFSILPGTNINCNIVKDYPNACEDYTDCEYIDFKGETVACINGEKIIFNPDFSVAPQPQIIFRSSSK